MLKAKAVVFLPPPLVPHTSPTFPGLSTSPYGNATHLLAQPSAILGPSFFLPHPFILNPSPSPASFASSYLYTPSSPPPSPSPVHSALARVPSGCCQVPRVASTRTWPRPDVPHAATRGILTKCKSGHTFPFPRETLLQAATVLGTMIK